MCRYEGRGGKSEEQNESDRERLFDGGEQCQV